MGREKVNTRRLFIKNTDFKVFGKPTSRTYRRMAVTLSYGSESTYELVEKAKEVASKIKVD